jgi:hypothetical protein
MHSNRACADLLSKLCKVHIVMRLECANSPNAQCFQPAAVQHAVKHAAASSPTATIASSLIVCNTQRTCRQLALHPRSKCRRQQRPSCGYPSCQCGCWRARSCTSQAWCLTTRGGEAPRTPGSGCAQATQAAERKRKGRQARAVSLHNREWFTTACQCAAVFGCCCLHAWLNRWHTSNTHRPRATAVVQ